MNYIKEEKEVSIKELVVYIILKWRSIFIGILGTMFITFVINIIRGQKYIKMLGMDGVIKASIKQSILISIVVIVLMIALYGFIYLFSDTIKSAHEFMTVCNIKIVGCIVNIEKNKNFIFDRWIKKINGVKYKVDEVEQHKKCLAKILDRYVCDERTENKKRVVVISSCSVEYAEKLKDMVSDKISENVEIVVAGDIYICPDAIDIIASADLIVCAECQGKSKYKELNKLLKEIEGWEKEIIGVVLMNVEGI